MDILEHKSSLASPQVWAKWVELLKSNATLFETDPSHNLSVEGHKMAEAFGEYLATHTYALDILDIGCGPEYHFPTYLSHLHPDAYLTGIDPLLHRPMYRTPKMLKYRDLAERMSFTGGNFSLAIAATSLDHMVNLRAAMKEIRRVLGRGGHLVAWVRYWHGATEPDPFTDTPEPVDPHHLYHLDEPWFRTIWQDSGFELVHSRSGDLPKPGSFITLEAIR